MRQALFLFCIAALTSLAACASHPPIRAQQADAYSPVYRLDSGDRLRVTVFGQQDLTNAYTVDGSGVISMPLIGTVGARGRTTEELESAIAYDLRGGYLRNPSVSVQVEAYRPFYILGEVNSAGQYPFVDGMTGETAAAIAGGFTPRADKRTVTVTRRVDGQVLRGRQAMREPILPGDTVHVGERFF